MIFNECNCCLIFTYNYFSTVTICCPLLHPYQMAQSIVSSLCCTCYLVCRTYPTIYLHCFDCQPRAFLLRCEQHSLVAKLFNNVAINDHSSWSTRPALPISFVINVNLERNTSTLNAQPCAPSMVCSTVCQRLCHKMSWGIRTCDNMCIMCK